MKRLVFARPAAEDLERIVDHIALADPAAAEKVFRGVMEAAERLAALPAMGRPGRYPGTRELSIRRSPYLLVYEAAEDQVIILAVFHTARDIARALADRLRTD